MLLQGGRSSQGNQGQGQGNGNGNGNDNGNLGRSSAGGPAWYNGQLIIKPPPGNSANTLNTMSNAGLSPRRVGHGGSLGGSGYIGGGGYVSMSITDGSSVQSKIAYLKSLGRLG